MKDDFEIYKKGLIIYNKLSDESKYLLHKSTNRFNTNLLYATLLLCIFIGLNRALDIIPYFNLNFRLSVISWILLSLFLTAIYFGLFFGFFMVLLILNHIMFHNEEKKVKEIRKKLKKVKK